MGRRGWGNAVLGDSWHGWVRPHESIPVHNPGAATTSFCIRSLDNIWSWFGASDARDWTWARCSSVSAFSTAEYDRWTFAHAKHDGWANEAAQYAGRSFADAEHDGWANEDTQYDEERERG